jgi:type III secretory pathway component EscT
MSSTRQRNTGKIAAALLLWILAIASVVTGELLPGDSAPMHWVGATGVSDKVLHSAAYTLLAVIPVFGFRLRAGLISAGVTVLLGVALEFAQTLVPGRSYEVADMVANALGVGAGIGLGLLGRKLWTRKSAGPPA